jgi:hypothetical protein
MKNYIYIHARFLSTHTHTKSLLVLSKILLSSVIVNLASGGTNIMILY